MDLQFSFECVTALETLHGREILCTSREKTVFSQSVKKKIDKTHICQLKTQNECFSHMVPFLIADHVCNIPVGRSLFSFRV